jgi:hypothetical protein
MIKLSRHFIETEPGLVIQTLEKENKLINEASNGILQWYLKCNEKNE